MEDKQVPILNLEQDANRLVDELVALKAQVSSYKTATNELDKARTALAGFLSKTEELTRQTHKLIETTNAIGSAKIFQELEAIRIAVAQNEKKAAKRILILILGLVLTIALLVATIVIAKGGR
jgi:hypothetical protein